ncbi:guanylate kinase [bacterium]|nr:guanylate kinase [bacterium]
MSFEKKGLLIVLSSPSGGGKTSIYRRILQEHPDYAYSISVTTRSPRKDEQNDKDYHFVSDREFEELKAKGSFIEWANVHNYKYGTLKQPLFDFLSLRKVIFLDIDVQGTMNIKEQIPDSVSIFILPPSFEQLKQRLIERKTDSPEVLNTRLKNAIEEVSFWSEYDYLVINDELESTVSTVEAIVVAELNRVNNYENFNWEIPEKTI